MKSDTTIRRITRQRRLSRWVATITLLAAAATVPAAAQQQAPRPAVEPPALDDTPLTQYRAFRRMHATNEKFNQEAWLEAWTELDQKGFRYEIVSTRGSRSSTRETASNSSRSRPRKRVAGVGSSTLPGVRSGGKAPVPSW